MTTTFVSTIQSGTSYLDWDDTTLCDVVVELDNTDTYTFSSVEVPSNFFDGFYGTNEEHELLYTILEEEEGFGDCRNYPITNWGVAPSH